MSRLILIRHGESMWNKADLFTGWVDVPLSEKGIQDAIAAGHAIRNIPFDRAFTSTLIRAQETLAIAMASHASGKTAVFLHPDNPKLNDWEAIYGEKALNQIIPVHISWHLNERMYGQLQGLNKAETRKEFGDEQVKTWRRSYAAAPPEGESLKTCAARTLPYFDREVLPCLQRGENILIVAHGNSLRSIIMSLDQLSEEEVIHLELTLGEPIQYTYESGKFLR